MITICLTYFRSLTLANLQAALYSVRQQDFSRVRAVVVVDNNTDDATSEILCIINGLSFPVPVRLVSEKHGDLTKTHTWSTNVAVSRVETPWIFFTRADYLLSFDAVEQLSAAATSERFIVGGYYDVELNVHQCEQSSWREHGPRVLQTYGREWDHVLIDSGVWMTTKDVFNRVGGMDESLSAWGHAQTVLQHKIYSVGVEFVRVPQIVFYHIAHNYEQPRDHGVAVEQLNHLGLSIRDLWARYDGPHNPYPR